jgi:hypothetical protein
MSPELIAQIIIAGTVPKERNKTSVIGEMLVESTLRIASIPENDKLQMST